MDDNKDDHVVDPDKVNTRIHTGNSVPKVSPERVAYGGALDSQHRGCMWTI